MLVRMRSSVDPATVASPLVDTHSHPGLLVFEGMFPEMSSAKMTARTVREEERGRLPERVITPSADTPMGRRWGVRIDTFDPVLSKTGGFSGVLRFDFIHPMPHTNVTREFSVTLYEGRWLLRNLHLGVFLDEGWDELIRPEKPRLTAWDRLTSDDNSEV